MSNFSNVKKVPPVEIYELAKLFPLDKSPQKVNLSSGTYKDENGKPWVLPVVRAAEIALADDEDDGKKSYIELFGLNELRIASTNLLLGEDSPAVKENRAFGIHSISGTGALRIGAEFLARHVGSTIFYYSNPSWDNHKLFLFAGFKEAREYRYWDPKKRGVDFEGLIADLDNAPEGAVIILHVCAHNPTGCDPTKEQWKQIAKVMKRRKLFPFFDSAYQGFATGDLDADAWSVRYFVSQGFELFCAQSHAKNFGLYNERVGNLTIVLASSDVVSRVQSQFNFVIRGMCSEAPAYGAQIVVHILKDADLHAQWLDSLKTMSSRILKMRKLFRKELEKIGAPGPWNHVTDQIGMFCYSGLNKAQSKYMLEAYHIYMLSTGRISICGLTEGNIPYVAQAIKETLENVA